MITALALVAGSSVIFTDPIFQGMAISLASGVMVSTILTLIVIPLGCIKASKSLCDVAAAGFTPTEAIPTMPDQPAAPVAEAAPKAYKTPLWLTIWSKLVGGVMVVFYLVRGIFLLLAQLFKRKQSAPPPPPPTPASPPATPTAGGAAPTGTPSPGTPAPGGTPTPASVAGQVGAQAGSSDEDTEESLAEPPVKAEKSPKVSKKSESGAVAAAEEGLEPDQAVASAPRKVRVKAGTGKKTGAVSRAEASPVKRKRVAGTKAVAKKAPPKSRVKSKAVKQTASTRSEPEMLSGSQQTQDDVVENQAPKASPTPRDKPRTPGKGGRRGIRLKNVGDNGGME